ncbi:MAG: ROK family protein [Candidatus Gastranaerophilales bacterium]|nr:ROK family protein [Candidatus Gastranaerophilales bacterium]
MSIISKKYKIGVDVGGTNVKVALVDKTGSIVYSDTVPTRAEMGYEYTISNIIKAIQNLMKESKTTKDLIDGIGFGFPGQIDCDNGIVRLAPNIPGWVNIPIADIVSKEFDIPVKVDNDVRCAALAELNYGAGKGSKNMICITVGTGIGSGLIINGKLVRGASNAAGEIGHIKLQIDNGPICGCGDTGCLEAFASGPAIVAMAEEYIKGGKSTKYRELANPEITPYIVAEAAKQGDVVAKKIFEIIGNYIGIGLSSVVNLLNPEKIVIGGGVADAGDLLFIPIKNALKKRAMPIQGAAVEVVHAELGNTAGVIGASLLIEN